MSTLSDNKEQAKALMSTACSDGTPEVDGWKRIGGMKPSVWELRCKKCGAVVYATRERFWAPDDTPREK